MTKPEVLAKLQLIFDDIFMEPVVVTETLSADDVPEWDSLLHISLVVAVERAFKIRFGVGELESTKNVGEFADLIVKSSGKA
jgi:acyl carrier protein